MERLTYWNEEYDCWSYRGPSGEAAKRLAAYEDTWLEPEVLKEFAPFLNEMRKSLDAMRRLKELTEADRGGRLVVLPDGKATWIKAILAERDRQDAKWGFPQENTYCEWSSILAEEVGELAKELNELNFGQGDVRRMEAEAVQVAAVALSILEQQMVAYQTTVKVEEAIGRLTRQEAEESMREEAEHG